MEQIKNMCSKLQNVMLLSNVKGDAINQDVCYLVALLLRNIQMSLTAHNSLIKPSQHF